MPFFPDVELREPWFLAAALLCIPVFFFARAAAGHITEPKPDPRSSRRPPPVQLDGIVPAQNICGNPAFPGIADSSMSQEEEP